jgi:serine/threonine protein kinase
LTRWLGRPDDVRPDLFSFGSVLYEIVTGRRAFAGRITVATLWTVLHLEPKPISGLSTGIPPELEKVIARCLRKDPESRIQHMVDVKLALEEPRQDSASVSLAAPFFCAYFSTFLLG